jgi:hypothetical protein
MKSGIEDLIAEVDEKVGVLEINKHAQVEHYTHQQQYQFFSFFCSSENGIG